MTQIPATLELTDHAELAIQHMANNVDPKLDFAPYFYLNMEGKPASCTHESWDYGDVTGRYIDALVSLRQMTGSTTGEDVEKKLKKLLVSTFRKEDGLTYRRKLEWSQYEAGMFDQGRTLVGLASWYMADEDKHALKAMHRHVAGLWNAATHVIRDPRERSFCFYPYTEKLPDGWSGKEKAEPTCYGGGCTIHGLAKILSAANIEQAGALAERLTNFIIYETGIFKEDGSYRPASTEGASAHLHSKSLTILGILKLAIALGRKDLIEWAQRAFEFTLTCGTQFGWFPEGIGPTPNDGTRWSETCCTTDIMEIAALLARNGYPQYWQHVERFTRNYMVESQILDTSWMAETPKKKDTKRSRYKNATDAIRGGFVGRALPNDLIADGHLMACCCGAGARAVYQAWYNTFQVENGSGRVNLLWNFRRPEIEIESLLPHQGKVRIMNHLLDKLAVRLPKWTTPDAVKISANGKPAVARVNEGYVHLSRLRPGNNVEMEFPIRTEQRTETIFDWTYDETWRGDTLIEISPGGVKVPLYQREHMKSIEVPLRAKPYTPKKSPTVHW